LIIRNLINQEVLTRGRRKMSMPDKANYILYSIVYIAVGVLILRGFLKISGSSKNFPKTRKKDDK
jgi:hypothetical protein